MMRECRAGVFLLSGLLAGCATDLHIRQVSLESTDSPQCYAAYRWDESILRDDRLDEIIDPSFDLVIQQAVDDVLKEKGYQEVSEDTGSAMILSVQLTVQEAVESYPAVNTTDVANEATLYGLQWRLPAGNSQVKLARMPSEEQVTTLVEGTLHIGAFNPEKFPMWHVMGHRILERDHHSPEKHIATLQRTVRAIMSRFPDSDAPGECS